MEVAKRPGLVRTEDFLAMLDGMGIEAGIHLDRILTQAKTQEKMVGRRPWSFCRGTKERPGSGRISRFQHYR